MCEKPKDPDLPEPDNKNSEKRSYYYDDAHGYEEYDPDDETDEDPDESA